MSQLIDSLRRLYLAEKITLAQVESMLAKGSITQDEFNYITSIDVVVEGTDLNGAES